VSWPVVKIKTVCQQVRGVTYKKDKVSDAPKVGYVKLYRSNNISPEGGLNEYKLIYVHNSCVKEKQLLKTYDILITASTGSKSAIGKNAQLLNDIKVTFGAFCKTLRPKQNLVDPLYLGYFFKRPEFRAYISNVVEGANINNLKNEHIDELDIPLPPLPVQKQIAAVLEKADTLRSQCQQMEKALNSLAQSVFLDMFGDPTQTKFSKLKLSECLSKIESGWSPKCESFAAEAGRPGILKLGAVTSGVYLEKENKAMTYDSEPKAALEVKSGDLLFTRKNTFDLVAAVAYVQRTRSKLYLPDLIFRFVPIDGERISKIYLWGLFSSVNFRKIVQSLATGAAGSMPNISKAKLLDLAIPYPPIELQEQYENCIVKIWELMATHEIKKKEINETFESVLQRAFKGELALKDVA
jgi:type I restriction enzyme S subunit